MSKVLFLITFLFIIFSLFNAAYSKEKFSRNDLKCIPLNKDLLDYILVDIGRKKIVLKIYDKGKYHHKWKGTIENDYQNILTASYWSNERDVLITLHSTGKLALNIFMSDNIFYSEFKCSKK